jgi:hypothetical protein
MTVVVPWRPFPMRRLWERRLAANFNRENLLTAVSTIRGASRSVSFF